MKAAPADQRLLLVVADIDAQLAQVRHRVAHLPEDAELTRLTGELSGQRDAQVRAEISVEDAQRESSRLEAEITLMGQRIERDSDLLAGGGLAPKALAELQHEVTSLGRRRDILEDELLSLMEQQEAIDVDQQRAREFGDRVQKEIDEVTAKRDTARREAADRETDLLARRGKAASDVPPDLLAVYDRVHAGGRTGAARLVGARCGGCGIEFDRGTYSKVSSAPADDVVRCEECGAILVRGGQ